MGFMKSIAIDQHNERMKLNAIIKDHINDNIDDSCDNCYCAFTNDNPQVTDDSQLCFKCWEATK